MPPLIDVDDAGINIPEDTLKLILSDSSLLLNYFKVPRLCVLRWLGRGPQVLSADFVAFVREPAGLAASVAPAVGRPQLRHAAQQPDRLPVRTSCALARGRAGECEGPES